jgi:hypothetical protein
LGTERLRKYSPRIWFLSPAGRKETRSRQLLKLRTESKVRVHERIEFADLTHQLTSKSDAELEHFLEFGSWPEDVDVSHPASEKTKAN